MVVHDVAATYPVCLADDTESDHSMSDTQLLIVAAALFVLGQLLFAVAAIATIVGAS